MRDYFEEIAGELSGLLRGSEVFTCTLDSESSDFVRFNQSAVRQAGSVLQHHLRLDLIDGRRHASGRLSLAGDLGLDRPRLRAQVAELREILGQLPEDPHLLYAREPRSSERVHADQLPRGEEAVDAILGAAAGRDLVGIYARGGVYAGFANSLGQRNWYANHSFHLDWSLYEQSAGSIPRSAGYNGAVKDGYAGTQWRAEELARRVARADEQLRALARPPHAPALGRHRVYLAPAALQSILELLSWDAFGLRARRTRTTPLVRLAEGEIGLHPGVRVAENSAEGIAPDFQGQGFLRPPEIVLIEGGRSRDALVSPRSSVEYGVPTNGASPSESPLSLDLAAGELASEDILEELGTGVYVSNLWYLNYSDRRACRTTGMTRFATFWVERGRIQAPLAAMRFDESLYRMLGELLVGLTREREMLLDPESYGARSTRSARLPGALVAEFAFTL